MEFFIPHNREELVETLKKKQRGTYFAAGCTDLIIRFREKGIYDYSLIDLTHIEEGCIIKETKDSVNLSAFVTMSELINNPTVLTFHKALVTAASLLGSTQIRNRATIGGNLANASQSADLVPVLAASDAKIMMLNSKNQLKALTIDELILGSGKTSLKEDEVIWEIEFPKKDYYYAFSKVGARKSVSISKLNCCIRTNILNGCITNPVIYLGAVGSKAQRAPLIEKALEGILLDNMDDKELINFIWDEAKAQIESNIPDRQSKYYKKEAIFGLLMDVLKELLVQYDKEGSHEQL